MSDSPPTPDSGAIETLVSAKLGYYEADTYTGATGAERQVGLLRAAVFDLAHALDVAMAENARLHDLLMSHLYPGEYESPHPELARENHQHRDLATERHEHDYAERFHDHHDKASDRHSHDRISGMPYG